MANQTPETIHSSMTFRQKDLCDHDNSFQKKIYSWMPPACWGILYYIQNVRYVKKGRADDLLLILSFAT
jgi:hypothetical protein